MRLALLFLSGMILLPTAAQAGKKKKSKVPAEPIEGWHHEEGWKGDCYYPPTFEGLASGPKRMAWQATRDALISQWRGDRGDGMSVSEKAVTNAETALLGKPERIEQVAADNLAKCQAAMSGAGTGAWSQWVSSLAGELTAGECPSPPMDYTQYQYLAIDGGWQAPVRLCKGDVIVIHGTPADYYRIDDDGPWINVEGDTSEPASGDLPCTLEGCYKGQLIMQFTGVSGVQSVAPVGTERVFTAPEHGKVEIRINETTFYNNEWKVEKGLEHHTGVEYKPAGG